VTGGSAVTGGSDQSLRGSFVPLVTPFDEDLKVDYDAYAALVNVVSHARRSGPGRP
jgi:dihydrodipicolinate synthase/N-acetylneuraminate lyase